MNPAYDMEYRLAEYSINETGCLKDSDGNPRQEDSVYPDPSRPGDWSRLFVVCDGMGGIGAGDVASATVCRVLGLANDDSEPDFSKEDLAKALVRAYDAIDREDHGQSKAMGTTMAMLRLCSDGAMVAHIGDCRVYHIRPGSNGKDTKILFQTKDHTHPSESPSSTKARKALNRAMMTKMKRRCNPEVHMLTDICAGDYFMLCTDGMLENMNDDAIRIIFSHDGGTDHNKHGLLLKATANNEDNHSAIIVHILEVINDAAKDMSAKNNERNTDYTMKNPLGKIAVPMPAKLLIAFMAIMTMVMIFHSLFVRIDEVLQPAGTAVDKPLNADGTSAGEETYGYEITAQDIRNEAQQIAPEITIDEPVEVEQTTEREDTETPETTISIPVPSDEPILQE